jgi:hypothetical protein
MMRTISPPPRSCQAPAFAGQRRRHFEPSFAYQEAIMRIARMGLAAADRRNEKMTTRGFRNGENA